MSINPDSLPELELDEGRAIAHTDAEKKLLAAARAGAPAFISAGLDVNDADAWGEDQAIRAAFLRHLCLHPDRHDIDPQGIHIEGALVAGELNLDYAELNIPLVVGGSRFTDTLKMRQATTLFLYLSDSHLPGLEADGLRVAGNVFLRGATVRGETRLLGADIGGNLECDNAMFNNPDGTAFNAQRMRVGERFFWRGFTPEHRPRGCVDLTHARVGDFGDDGTGWPDAGKLLVDGFQYENIGPTPSAAERQRWLALMPKTRKKKPAYWPQPYEQLIKVFRNAGHERDARLIAIAK